MNIISPNGDFKEFRDTSNLMFSTAAQFEYISNVDDIPGIDDKIIPSDILKAYFSNEFGSFNASLIALEETLNQSIETTFSNINGLSIAYNFIFSS